jgi:hypothetical protein
MPHILTNPEMHPHLTPGGIATMDLEALQLTMNDYQTFDGMTLFPGPTHGRAPAGTSPSLRILTGSTVKSTTPYARDCCVRYVYATSTRGHSDGGLSRGRHRLG